MGGRFEELGGRKGWMDDVELFYVINTVCHQFYSLIFLLLIY